MAVSSIRIRRRAVGGSAGAPASLKTAELAYNMADGFLYVGYGDDGSGNATTVRAFAKDNYVDPSGVYQPLDSDLTALAGLSATAGSLHRTGAGAFAVRTLTGTAGRVTVTNGDGASANPTFDLATVSVGTATSGGSTKFTVDGYGRVTNASQASLSDLSAPTANFSLGNFRLTSVADPSGAQDAATKNYVDNAITGLNPKTAALVATTASITLSGEQTVDGVLTSASRVLVKNQATPAQNGIYVSGAGAWARAADADTWNELRSAYVFVEQGSTHADQGWLCTVDAGGTLGTTPVSWVQFSGTGAGGGFTVAGAGLTASGSTVDVAAGTGITVAGDSVALAGQALALHNVATAADQIIYATGVSTFAATGLSSFARTLLDDADATTARSTLGLGSMATQAASNVAITGGSIDGVTVDGGTF